MKNKVINLENLNEIVKDSMTIMVSGFMGCGSPHKIIDKLVELGVKDLTLVCNDTGFVDYGVGKMVVKKQFKKIQTSHIGLNPEAIRQLNDKETELIKAYAEINNISLSDLVRNAVIEKIENEYDLECYKKAMEEYKKNPKTYTIEEIKEELELQ